MPDITKFPLGASRELRLNQAANAVWADPQWIAKRRAPNPHEKGIWLFEPGSNMVFLGAIGDQLIGARDDRHLMTIAGSRAGKGESAVIPNLIAYPGSILVIDPKGENARATKSSRDGTRFAKTGLKQDVFVLDPFGRSGHPTSSFNPLDMIKPESDEAVDDAALIADGLVIALHGEGKHWSDSARNFLRGLVLYVRVAMPPELQNLIWVRRLLTNDKSGFDLLLKDMALRGDSCNGVIRGAANSMAAKWEEERSGVVSTLIEQTDFLDSPRMATALERSDFTLSDLKRKPTTIYLCLPASRMATHNRWLRVIINLAVQAMEHETTKPPHPVLFIMDEFAILDHLSSVEKAAGQIAGFDVRLWPILQDLSQLKSIYSDRWETFMGNAGLLQFFGNNDLTTLEYLSKRLGKSTIVQINQSEVTTPQKAQGLTGQSMSLHETELMASDEIGTFFSRQSETQLLLWPGAPPIAIDRVKYHKHTFFGGKYDGQ